MIEKKDNEKRMMDWYIDLYPELEDQRDLTNDFVEGLYKRADYKGKKEIMRVIEQEKERLENGSYLEEKKSDKGLIDIIKGFFK